MIKKINNIYFFLLVTYAFVFSLMKINFINFYWQGVIRVCLINIMLVASLNLATGFVGQLFLSHSSSVMIGAYFSAAVTMFVKSRGALEFSTSVFLSGIMSACLAFAVGKAILKVPGVYVAMLTLAINEIISSIINNTTSGTVRQIEYYPSFSAVFIFVFLVLLIFYKMLDSKLGRAMKAISYDANLSRVCGIDVYRYRMLSFLISAFVAGLCGAVYAHEVTIIDTEMFDYKYTFSLLSMVVIGGLGNLTGSIISAIVLTIVPHLFGLSESLKSVLYLAFMVLLLVFFPNGVFDYKKIDIKSIINRFKRKLNEIKNKVKKRDKKSKKIEKIKEDKNNKKNKEIDKTGEEK
ncbi:MAG: branched-chain amino acid ABC transporter permease [Clostridiales bacterium]|nr:branched-chain amino acid ABC transporter permease [Clostridiales bacterium]